jgi:hypothetical protein
VGHFPGIANLQIGHTERYCSEIVLSAVQGNNSDADTINAITPGVAASADAYIPTVELL